MSITTNKDNVYFMAPFMNGEYGEDFSNFMEGDFTIYVKCKLIENSLEKNDPSYFFSRNGKHSGMCLVKNYEGLVFVNFSYWVKDKNDKSKHIIVPFLLPESYLYKTNEYIMTCNHEESIIDCYINNLKIGTIDYKNMIKENYDKSFIWFGCGTMFAEDRHKNIGEYEYELVFGLDKFLTIDEIVELKESYVKDITIIGDGLPIINKDISFKKNIKFLMDFENKTRYKIWNLAFNGHNPQIYIENNILF